MSYFCITSLLNVYEKYLKYFKNSQKIHKLIVFRKQARF